MDPVTFHVTYAATLYSCDRCGAVVNHDARDKHAAWHERLTASLQAVAGLLVQVVHRNPELAGLLPEDVVLDD